MKFLLGALFLSAVCFSTAQAQSTGMVCKGSSVNFAVNVTSAHVEVQSQLVSTGDIKSTTRSLDDIIDGVFYVGTEANGRAFDFNLCNTAQYVANNGIGGAFGFRILKDTVKSCVCTQ